MLTRREFLSRSSLLALAPSVPAFLAQTVRAAEARGDGRVLVVLQLSGGNDGINTVVPFADEGYARARKDLRLNADKLIKINDAVALHPAMRSVARLLESGRLAIVQGVGYPNPNRSHEVSMAIWQTARFDKDDHNGYGWIGRALDSGTAPANGAPGAMLVGTDAPPLAIRARRSTASALADLNDFALIDALAPKPAATTADDAAAFIRRSALDAYTTAERLKDLSPQTAALEKYPTTELAKRLSLVARLIKAGFETPVYYVIQPGYDTHAVQLPAHDGLLRELSGGLGAFLDDLTAAGLADRVAVMAFSEFGRRVEENGSLGTDHGTAGPVFLAGGLVQPGLVGTTPSLTDLEDGDVKTSVDFRRVYASVLTDWLGLDSTTVLGAAFDLLPLFRKG